MKIVMTKLETGLTTNRYVLSIIILIYDCIKHLNNKTMTNNMKYIQRINVCSLCIVLKVNKWKSKTQTNLNKVDILVLKTKLHNVNNEQYIYFLQYRKLSSNTVANICKDREKTIKFVLNFISLDTRFYNSMFSLK